MPRRGVKPDPGSGSFFSGKKPREGNFYGFYTDQREKTACIYAGF